VLPEHTQRALKKLCKPKNIRARDHVFVIHGRDEAKWRELRGIIKDTFGLKPIILNEKPDAGCTTVIEKFEHYAKMCNYAIALFTPDDEVSFNSERYLQARPNVIYELGWFCAKLGRSSVMLVLKEGTSIFSDFSGIIQKRFRANVAELEGEIRRDLAEAGILEKNLER
jgi:predicted nucleotide-binding protein